MTEDEVKTLFHELKETPTESRERSWYEDTWTETVPDWRAITRVVNAAIEKNK